MESMAYARQPDKVKPPVEGIKLEGLENASAVVTASESFNMNTASVVLEHGRARSMSMSKSKQIGLKQKNWKTKSSKR